MKGIKCSTTEKECIASRKTLIDCKIVTDKDKRTINKIEQNMDVID